jgi:hypothetical protein
MNKIKEVEKEQSREKHIQDLAHDIKVFYIALMKDKDEEVFINNYELVKQATAIFAQAHLSKYC